MPPDEVWAVAEAILSATPPPHSVQMVGALDDDDEPKSACFRWISREKVDVVAIDCTVRPDGMVSVYPIPVKKGASRSFDLCDPQSFDKLQRWLTDHGVPTAEIGADVLQPAGDC